MEKMGTIALKLIVIFFGIITAIFVLFVAGFMFIIPAINNIKANQYEKSLTAIQLPKETELITSNYYIGHFGSENGTDYFISMIVKSKQSIEKLKKHYKGYKVKEQTGDSVEEGLLGEGKMSFKELRQVHSFENYYMVYSYEEPDFNSILYKFDYRGL